MTHAVFELGIATMIKPLRINKSLCSGDNFFLVTSNNLNDWYRLKAQDVANMDIYNHFSRSGWKRSITEQIKKELLPLIVQSVCLVWYGATQENEHSEKK